MISFIVSTYQSDRKLRCLLSSLDLQTVKAHSIWIADNAPKGAREPLGAHWEEIPRRIFPSDAVGEQLDCYSAADWIVSTRYEELGGWLCFPSDDGYYVPGFSERMLKRATEADADLVICDCIYDPRRTGKWEAMSTHPSNCHIDKGGFIVKKDWYVRVGGFCGNVGGVQVREYNPCMADGYFCEDIVRRNGRWAKAAEVLWVHS